MFLKDRLHTCVASRTHLSAWIICWGSGYVSARVG